MSKKVFKIPVLWEEWGTLHIEADSLEEAKEKALEGKLPHGDYVEGSFKLDDDSVINELNK